MDTVPLRRGAARRPHRGVRSVRQRGVLTRDGTSASRHLRCGLLRLARRRVPTTRRVAQSAPRTYLVAGTQEPFFLANATRWADTLRGAGADVVLTQRVGNHGDPFWAAEFPLMVAWAFGR